MFLLKTIPPLVIFFLARAHGSPLPQPLGPGNDALPLSSRITTPFHGADMCGESAFEDTTSDTAPLVTDCMTMIDNIANVNMENGSDGGAQTWGVENFFHQQHQLIQFGTCAFGIQGSLGGDAHFWVGNQDIIDVVKDAIAKFGGSGRIGAKGQMKCKSVGLFPVKTTWGIYQKK
jgi:hypothetical protein